MGREKQKEVWLEHNRLTLTEHRGCDTWQPDECLQLKQWYSKNEACSSNAFTRYQFTASHRAIFQNQTWPWVAGRLHPAAAHQIGNAQLCVPPFTISRCWAAAAGEHHPFAVNHPAVSCRARLITDNHQHIVRNPAFRSTFDTNHLLTVLV